MHKSTGVDLAPTHPDGWPLAEWAWRVGAAALLLLFPPFLNLLPSRFDIYEEVIVYEYLVGLGLIAGLLALARRPRPRGYWGLCALAGLGGLVRPTLVFHGAAAVVAGAVALWPRRGPKAPMNSAAETSVRPDHRAWNVGAGVGLFLLGGGLLYVTNLARFGNGFEFGHRLNVQQLYGSLYATRFDHPFKREPLGSAAQELFGWLFLGPRFNDSDYYRAGFVPGQSGTVRWREAYLTTYDLSYLAGILAGWAAGAAAGWRLWRGRRANLAVAVLALYSLLATGPLLGFYLRNGVIASRYLLDLMPAFAAALLAAWLAWSAYGLRQRRPGWWMGVSLLLLAAWGGWQISRSRSDYGPPRVFTWADVQERQKRSAGKKAVWPRDGRYAAPEAPARTGVPYNGAGWETNTGRLMPCVILLVDDPMFLELDLAAEERGLIAADPDQIRAKVGLEYLQRAQVERTAEGWKVWFHGPSQRRYQRGAQPVFLATVPNRHLADYQHSPWRLRQVRWREEPGLPP